MAKAKDNKQLLKCINYVESIKNVIQNPNTIMLALTDNCKEFAKEQLEAYGISSSGDLGQSLESKIIDNKTAQVSADGGHAVYVEYGAGIVGKKHPHKLAKENGVTYNEGDSIVHFENEDKDYWTYLNDKTGQFFKTHGQASKPFMLKAVNKTIRRAPSIIKQKIKELTK